MPTVLITGASSGIGKAAARLFAQRGWNVAATMRTPTKETELSQLPNVRLYPLDVTDSVSIEAALAAVLRDFGGLEVLVNNAGYGVDGVFEAMTDDTIARQFDTNVLGLMRCTRAVIPHFRQQGRGTIVQIASVGGRVTFPLYSIYHATKWAVEGFSESLQYELEPLGIKVKIIEPGAIKTDFYDRSREFVMRDDLRPAYGSFVQKVEKVSQQAGARAVGPEAVAATIFRAATDGKTRLRYPIAYPANVLLPLRRLVSDGVFRRVVKSSYGI
ncbi:SDR family oxidoreductase [Hymenobacter metallilatus]|uniref:SDR family oxidoreductase n=1 Tax=Hymenobacter metallilatus TaxID=2493666 RepID=A0A3R9NTZ5_9BACT|nr:SDR family oxidoreductase [Hymenobacter metallilatus]RSK37549.1 SDR family oxidoreductase [Hymenobacter metallilatus]